MWNTPVVRDIAAFLVAALIGLLVAAATTPRGSERSAGFAARTSFRLFGMLVGLSWAISQFTYAFGPGLLGVIRDMTGGYGAPLALCVTLKVVAAVLILMRPKPLSRA